MGADARPSAESWRSGNGASGSTAAHGTFRTERFHYDVPGRTFVEVLRAALDVLDLPPEDKELIYDLLVSREKLMTTALGDGLAIPHLRVPVVVDVPRPALSIFFTREPIDMGALDGKPVHTLFLLLSLTPKQHLELLARLTFLFRKPEFVKLLRDRAKPEIILEWIQRADAQSEQIPRKRLNDRVVLSSAWLLHGSELSPARVAARRPPA